MPVIHDAIRTNSNLDVYPTHEAKLGKGGYRTVANIAERDNIPFERCEEGMLVTVLDDDTNNNKTTTYILKQNTRDSRTWEKFNNGSVDVDLTNRVTVLETSSAKVDNEIVTLSNEISTKVSLNEHNNLVTSLATYALKSDLNTLATKDELNSYALKSEINNGGGIDENTLNQAINQNAIIQELGAKVNHIATNIQGASYAQLVATMKFLGYELPSELRAYADYNLYADDRLSGDLVVSFKPIEYTGSYGQAWENVAIYNDLGEKLTAKYASIDGSGLNIDAVFAKDERQPKGDSWEPVPSDYALLDGEVRVSITLGVISYYGATYGLRMLNNNPSSWSESFLGSSQNYNEWIFTFHNYKPTKFSITNGTATYGGYGYMTKYNMRLSIGNWSKTLTYNNSSYPNNIEVDLTNLNFGSDAKTIELAKAWNIPLTPYDINQDMVGE